MKTLIRLRSAGGATLTELLITIAIITVVGVGVARSFVYLARAIQTHRMRTLAANLSQEKIQALKALPYFSLIATSTPSYRTEFSPPLPYDSSLFGPESVIAGGNVFSRLTYVEKVIDGGGQLLSVPPDSLDTGLKRVTVTTIWKMGPAWMKNSISNLVANDSQPPGGVIQGSVKDASGAPVAHAEVYAGQNAYFHGVSDASGAYAFAVAPGTYTVSAGARGYFRATATAGFVGGGLAASVNFALVPMSSGSVTGAAYLDTHLLISQVVASSVTLGADLAPHDVEYVELFNPTTFPIDVGSFGAPARQLSYKGQTAVDDSLNVPLIYVSTFVKAGGYYLIANTSSFFLLGGWIAADAYYGSSYADLVKAGKAGAVQLTTAGGAVIDGVGWTDAAVSASAPWSKGAAIPQADGLLAGDQLVRMSSVGVLSSSLGRAYDPEDNAAGFGYRGGWLLSGGGLSVSPLSSVAPPQPVASGAPAYGAVVTANDSLSASTSAWRSVLHGSPTAAFTLVGVATGTWTVEVASGSCSLSVGGVAVSAGAATPVPNAATTPAWPASGASVVVLSSSTGRGIVSGHVLAAGGSPLANVEVDVEPVGSAMTSAQGYYAISAPAGTYSVIANPGGTSNPSYGSATLASVVVADGEYNGGNDLVLAGAGAVTGYICSYSDADPYPGVSVTARDSNGVLWGQAISGSDGRFSITGLSTGTYWLAPLIDGAQMATPSAQDVVVTLGATTATSTITITGAYATIAGTVTYSGAPLTTGALLVATTATIDLALPPALSSAALDGITYYATSSHPDGTFSLQVRASSAGISFNLYGWYVTYGGDVPQAALKKSASVFVTGGRTASAGLQWP